MRLQRKGKRRRVLLKSEYRLDLDMIIHNRYFLFSMLIVKKPNISSHHSDIYCPFMPAGCPGHWLVGTGMEGICHFENFVASGMAGIAKIAGGRAKAGTGMPVTHHYTNHKICEPKQTMINELSLSSDMNHELPDSWTKPWSVNYHAMNCFFESSHEPWTNLWYRNYHAVPHEPWSTRFMY